MDKIILVLKREYFERVKKKSFILVTLLTPIGIGLLVAVSAYFTIQSSKTKKNVLVVDESGIIVKSNIKTGDLIFNYTTENMDSLKTSYKKDGYDLLLHVPKFRDLQSKEHNVSYYTKEKLGLITIENIERKIGKAFKEYKIDQSGIDKELYASFKTDITLENGAMGEEDGENDTSGKLTTIIATAIGGIMGFLMYMVIFIYGGMVMKSVSEEKINRIVELMISSLKPFQLMMGKLLGVGAVGLTQLGIWLLLIPVIGMGISFVFGATQGDSLQNINDQVQSQDIPVDPNKITEILTELMNFNWGMILPVFLIFFIGGYLIYSSMFAAVGSAVGDDLSDSQQMMLPLSIPVIIAFLMLQSVIANPNGNLAIFGSMFPLFSPIIMPARLAFDPPIWQVVISVIILIATIVLFIWMAGKIYRTGILMYGKKISFKELGKWLFYK